MAQEADWRNLVAILRRIMAGERGVELAQGLDPVDTAIVRRVLGLPLTPQPPLPTTDSTSSGEGETPLPSPVDSSSVDRRGAGGEDEGITIVRHP